jgi:hypothetical protein
VQRRHDHVCSRYYARYIPAWKYWLPRTFFCCSNAASGTKKASTRGSRTRTTRRLPTVRLLHGQPCQRTQYNTAQITDGCESLSWARAISQAHGTLLRHLGMTIYPLLTSTSVLWYAHRCSVFDNSYYFFMVMHMCASC